MAHHTIKFKCKDGEVIPDEHRKSLNDFISELRAYRIEGEVRSNTVNFIYLSNCWLYDYDIESLIKGNKITSGMIEAYIWLREHTNIESDCWNVCDFDYGPNSWNDIERNLKHIKEKYDSIIRQIKK